MQEDVSRAATRVAELDQLGEELAENYEELSLLYRLSAGMSLDQPADLFLQGACKEMQEVAGLRWLTLRLSPEVDRLQQLRGRSYDAGDRPEHCDLAALETRLRETYGHRTEPVILDKIDSLGPAGCVVRQNLLIVPLIRDGVTLGLLIGADRLDGQLIDSITAKLCGSLCNSLTIFLDNTMLLEDAQSLFVGSLHALTSAIDAKDSYTCGHSERVALLSRMLARAVGYGPDVCERVYLAGLVHDVGKIGVPEAVLRKPGRLTDDEFGLIKQHPRIGANILRDIRQMSDLLPGVLYHHEKFGGGGYPDNLRGDAIPLFGRIICLADAFDAMSSNRTYRAAMSHGRVLSELRNCAGSQFDPQLVQAFLKLDFQPFFDLIEKHRDFAGSRLDPAGDPR
jgi:HD-GYP domain-containing protein (c-di-GMP phosphodiesterase class II)